MKNPLFTSEIDEIIVRLLGDSLYKTTDLLETVQKKHPISKQGFYDALRRLKKAQIILINKKIVSLNNLWIESLVKFTQNVARTYEKSYRLESKYLNLQPGEKVSYNFRSIEEADIFWNHAVLLLVRKHNLQSPICVYNPHQWFFQARHNTEQIVYTRLAEFGAFLLVAIGGSTQKDKDTVKEMNAWHKNVKASITDQVDLPRNRYTNVYDNIIVEMKMPLAASNSIDEWFKQEDSTVKELEKIIQSTSNIKFSFSNNPKRAQKLRRQITQNFHVPKRLNI